MALDMTSVWNRFHPLKNSIFYMYEFFTIIRTCGIIVCSAKEEGNKNIFYYWRTFLKAIDD